MHLKSPQALLLVLLLPLSCPHALTLISPTGRQVPLNAVAPYVPLLEPYKLRTALYELDESRILHGHAYQVNLSIALAASTKVTPPSRQTVFVDGLRQLHSSPSITIHEVAGHTVVESASGDIRSISTSDLQLVAVPELPGLFVAAHSNHRTLSRPRYNILAPSRSMSTAQSSERVTRPQRSCARDMSRRSLQLAVVADSAMCHANGGSARAVQDKLTYLLHRVQRVFKVVSCISLEVVRVDIHCARGKDPYISARRRGSLIQPPIDAFLNIFPQRSSKHDVALYVAPAFETDDNAGAANGWVGCDEHAFAWADSSQTDFSTYVTIAHELGHTFGLEHAQRGVMSVTEPETDFFSKVSAHSLLAFLRSDRAACVAPRGRQRIGSRGQRRCASGRRKSREFGFRGAGRVPGPTVDGRIRDVNVQVRLYEGKLSVRVVAPKGGLKHGKYRKIGFKVAVTVIVVEYETAGGEFLESFDSGRVVTVSVPEKVLNMPARRRSCCGGRLRVDVQTTVMAYEKGGKEIEDFRTPSGASVTLPVACA